MLLFWSPRTQSYFNSFHLPTWLRCVHIHGRLHLLALAFPWICGLFTRASGLIFPALAALPAVSGVDASHGSHLTWTVALAPLPWRASVSLLVSLADSGFLQWPACPRPASSGPSPRSSVCSCWCHRPYVYVCTCNLSFTNSPGRPWMSLFIWYFYSILQLFVGVSPCVCHMYSEIWQWKCKRNMLSTLFVSTQSICCV